MGKKGAMGNMPGAVHKVFISLTIQEAVPVGNGPLRAKTPAFFAECKNLPPRRKAASD